MSVKNIKGPCLVLTYLVADDREKRGVIGQEIHYIPGDITRSGHFLQDRKPMA